MIGVIVSGLLVACCVGSAIAQRPHPPELDCGAAVLIDPETRQVIYERNADKRLFPASLTKMMTALLVAESGDLTRTVRISQRVASVGEASMNLAAGEELRLDHLLTGVLLPSANDAAVACAEAVSGSLEDFVARMNERAQELGMTGTHFVNPHGLHDDNHYSTARDLAILAVHVMGRAELRPIVRTQEAVVPWPGRTYDRKLMNSNQLLAQWPAADGVKTGYTRQAGNCLAASAYIDGWRLICVVLNCERRPWTEAQTLLQWGFDNFLKVALVSADLTRATIEVRGGVEAVVNARAVEDIIAIVPRGPFPEPVLLDEAVDAPVAAGQMVGQLGVSMPDGKTRVVDLLAVEDVARSLWAKVVSDYKYFIALAFVIALAVGVLVHGAASEAVGSRRTG